MTELPPPLRVHLIGLVDDAVQVSLAGVPERVSAGLAVRSTVGGDEGEATGSTGGGGGGGGGGGVGQVNGPTSIRPGMSIELNDPGHIIAR